MSHSERDNDIRKLRQLFRAKSALVPVPCTLEQCERIYRSPAYRRLQAEFEQLFSKYGFNPDIFKDNERAGSKRDVTKKIKDALRRKTKRSSKQRLGLRREVSAQINVNDDTSQRY